MSDEGIIHVERRSDRSMVRLVMGQRLEQRPDVSVEMTSLLISICHCTGWSAERISLCFKLNHYIEIDPDTIWLFFWKWVLERRTKKMEVVLNSEIELMVYIMRRHHVEWDGDIKRPLNDTKFPTIVTARFAGIWDPDDPEPLFKGYSVASRTKNKNHLHERDPLVSELTDFEAKIIRKFGDVTEIIVRNIMKQFIIAIRLKYEAKQNSLRPLNFHECQKITASYLEKYQDMWEENFGLMEETEGKGDGVLVIRSTGFGIKNLLGQMMSDRMEAENALRKDKRESLGFEKVAPEDVSKDIKNCPICREEFGTENEDGIIEDPLMLHVCCGQAIGEECLKIWLGVPNNGPIKHSCPCCRYVFPRSFKEKLFGDDFEALENHGSAMGDYGSETDDSIFTDDDDDDDDDDGTDLIPPDPIHLLRPAPEQIPPLPPQVEPQPTALDIPRPPLPNPPQYTAVSMYADVRAIFHDAAESFGHGIYRASSEPILPGPLPSSIFVSREAQMEWNRQFMLSPPPPQVQRAPAVQHRPAPLARYQANLVDLTRQVLPWPWGMVGHSQNPGLPQMAPPVLSPVPARAQSLNPEADEFVPSTEAERREGYEDVGVQADLEDGSESHVYVEGFAGQYWRNYGGGGERRVGR